MQTTTRPRRPARLAWRSDHGGSFLRRCLTVAAALVCGLSARSATAQQTPPLIPANIRQVVDAQGFRWDVSSQGQIGNGQNNCFSNAARLNINGNSFQPRQTLMTPDGSEYVFVGSASNVQVTRRVKVDLKACAVRYLEVVRNPTSVPISVSLRLETRLGRSPAHAMVTDRGGPGIGLLGKNDTGIVAYAPPSTGQSSVVFHLAGARSKLKPIIHADQMSRFTITYQVSVPAGKNATILHGLAQRRLNSKPDAKAAATLLKPFSARGWTRDLPADIRRALVNAGGFRFAGLGQMNLLVSLESLDVAPGPSDVLAVGEQTRLHGTAACTGLAVETRFGKAEIPLEKVAALAGRRFTGGTPRVLLQDGQILSGKLTVEELTFTMNTGLPVRVTLENLDRLVMRAASDRAGATPDVFAMLETFEGDRLSLAPSKQEPIRVTTPWGDRQVALENVRRWVAAEGHIGHRLVLDDGSRLFAFLDDRTLVVKTLMFGPQEFRPVEIRSIVAADNHPDEQRDPGDLSVPHLVLAGENLLVGQIDLPVVHLAAGGQPIPVPPGQVRLMRKISSDDESFDGGGAAFDVELWDGGTVSGKLQEAVLPVRCDQGVRQVLARDIVEIRVPAPAVPEGVRAKIADLIRDLGHPEYARRQAARKALVELGHLPKLQLEAALGQTTDPEVRRSVEALLEDLR